MKLPQTLLGPRFLGLPDFFALASVSVFLGRPGPRLTGAEATTAAGLGWAEAPLTETALPPNRAMMSSTCCSFAAN